MKKENYREAEFEIILFDSNDVITTSESSEISLDPIDENQTELL